MAPTAATAHTDQFLSFLPGLPFPAFEVVRFLIVAAENPDL